MGLRVTTESAGIASPRTPSSSEFELRDYLRVVWRRKPLVILTVVVAVAIAVVVSYVQTPVYEAKATIVLQQTAGELVLDPSQLGSAENERTVNTELEVLRSQTVVDATETAVGRPVDVSAGVLGMSDVLEVRARSTDPDQATLDANAYALAYVDFRREQAIDELDIAIEVVADRIDDIDGRILALPEEAFAERSGLESQRELYTQRLDQLQLAAGLASGPTVLTLADRPSSPLTPQPVRNGALAFVIGLVLGVALAFLREYLDDSIKTKEDLERAADVTVVGLIPTITSWKDRSKPHLVSGVAPDSPAAEAYRTLRTSVQFLSLDHPIQTLQVTSVNPEESKTTTVANLAVAMARTGTRIIIVGSDLRRPRIHEFFGATNDVGLTSVILGDSTLSDAVQSVSNQPNLALLASGPLPPNPSELLGSKRMRETLRAVQEHCDLVLLDSPPVLPVADAMVLSGLVDATLLVARAGMTTRSGAHRAVELLHQVGAPLVGTVLSAVAAGASYGDGAEYSSYAVTSGGRNGARGRTRAKT